jgi:hypothetical protein
MHPFHLVILVTDVHRQTRTASSSRVSLAAASVGSGVRLLPLGEALFLIVVQTSTPTTRSLDMGSTTPPAKPSSSSTLGHPAEHRAHLHTASLSSCAFSFLQHFERPRGQSASDTFKPSLRHVYFICTHGLAWSICILNRILYLYFLSCSCRLYLPLFATNRTSNIELCHWYTPSK